MKTASMIVVGLLIATVAIGDTNEFVTLQKAYEASVKQAVTPLTKAYLQKLDALKKKFGASGDLDSAQIVQREIDQLSSSVTTEPISIKLKIVSAKFGVEGHRWIDATEYIKKRCENTNVVVFDLDVERTLGDPAYGFLKHLVIDYECNGKCLQKDLMHEDRVILDATNKRPRKESK